MHLALLGLDIGPGDEVIVPTLTYIATANAVLYVGAKPIFIDSCSDNFNLDIAQIESKITDRTKAIIAVHLYGEPMPMKVLMALAEKHNLYVVEDAAEAHGAEVDGQKVGSFGHISTFSFFGNKIVTCGEGGAVLTGDEEMANRMAKLRSQGQSENKRFWHDVVGYNYRMTNLQAAVGVAQIEMLDWHLAQRDEISERYDQLLEGTERVHAISSAFNHRRVCWLYPALVDLRPGVTIEKLIDALLENGIETRPFFYPLHTMEIHRQEGNFPSAVRYNKYGICLPTWVGLSATDQEKIVAELDEQLQI